jgi:microcompartment protein CcmK/EutM
MYDLPKGQGDNPNKLAMTVGNDELNGLYHLFVYTIDEAGNEELLRSLLMFDNAGPEINVEISEDYAKYEIDANGDLYDVTNARKVANFVDEHVDRDEASNIVVTYTFMKDGKAVLMDELQGEYVLVIEAKDSLGNTSRKEVNVKADNIGPNVVLENVGTNSNPVFTVTDINGVDWESAQYCIYMGVSICEDYSFEKADSYDVIAEVDAWDKSFNEKSYIAETFPVEVDKDGDGIVYYIRNSGSDKDIPYDLKEYNEWRKQYIPDEDSKIIVPYMNFTEENINDI